MSAYHHSQREVVAIKHVYDGTTTIAPTNTTLSDIGNSSLLVEKRGRSTYMQTHAIGDYSSGSGYTNFTPQNQNRVIST